MIINYTIDNGYSVTKWKIRDVASWKDEPYPPGGFLRIMRDKDGRILSGPHTDEIVSMSIQYEDA